jgi:hypothetical protein
MFAYKEPVIKAPTFRGDKKSLIRALMPKTVRRVESRKPAKEIAGVRIREFLWDIGREMDHEYGWIAFAAKRAGLHYETARALIHGVKINVGPDVVDQISMSTGCPVGVFYDLDVESR